MTLDGSIIEKYLRRKVNQLMMKQILQMNLLMREGQAKATQNLQLCHICPGYQKKKTVAFLNQRSIDRSSMQNLEPNKFPNP